MSFKRTKSTEKTIDKNLTPKEIEAFQASIKGICEEKVKGFFVLFTAKEKIKDGKTVVVLDGDVNVYQVPEEIVKDTLSTIL